MTNQLSTVILSTVINVLIDSEPLEVSADIHSVSEVVIIILNVKCSQFSRMFKIKHISIIFLNRTNLLPII